MDFDVKKFIKLMKPFVNQSYTTQKSVVDGMFYQPGSKNGDWNFGSLNKKGNDILLELNKNYQLPKELIYMYLGLKTEHEDLVYEGFSFMSLNTIYKNNKEQRSSGQVNFLDIGMCYAGMGHCFVLAWIREEQKFFFRMDGGANGYDVEYNYQRYIKTKLDFSKYQDKMMDWEELKTFLGDNNKGDFFEVFHKLCI
jgi:hypothetical protein